MIYCMKINDEFIDKRHPGDNSFCYSILFFLFSLIIRMRIRLNKPDVSFFLHLILNNSFYVVFDNHEKIPWA